MTSHLTDEKIDTIVRVLDGWEGPLTWELLREAVTIRLGDCPTRQGLSDHSRIAKRFRRRKLELKRGSKAVRSGRVEVEKLIERLNRSESENKRLEAENSDLLDQFRRWAYNAHIAGLSPEALNEPLPPIDRRAPK
jgi:hypothetical protein